MIRAALAWLASWIRGLGHEHIYEAKILTADRADTLTIRTTFCATCGRYPDPQIIDGLRDRGVARYAVDPDEFEAVVNDAMGLSGDDE